ncbi:Fe-S cluster assembly protein SufD [Fodinisporobacter ferrooxydans]|uniref:Fe-S cluster assembly protein SufD n=1 Tax=Fodinisporobacter ferrooxydans TaxID=2901836 RepID=A0ABY4CM92_9BACL|nr:Fe-S cluster assembly protein SufD [Alicyclobacillaceae bacterium MYW30-H2]
MTVQQTVTAIDPAAIRAFSEQAQEPSWLTDMRLQAWETYHKLPVPKLEKTDLSKRKLDYFELYLGNQKDSLVQLPGQLPSLFRLADENQSFIFSKNGDVLRGNIQNSLQAQGVIYTDLRTAAQTYESLVKPYLGQMVKVEDDKFAALNAAVWGSGVFLYVPRNMQVEVPLQAFFWENEERAGMFTRVLIVVEEGASVTYIDGYQGEQSGDALHVGVVEVYVKANASVQYHSIQNNASNMNNLVYRQAQVDRDGSIDWNIGELGDGFTVAYNKTVLDGQGSKSDTKVITVGNGRQQLDLTCHTIHVGKHSESDMMVRGVMRDRAKAVYRGNTQILKGASGSNGQQEENLLLLSPKAIADAIPMLLIDENDVKCGHAASVGKINAEQLYYLMSRGISREDAEKLIIFGFLDPVIVNIPLDGVQHAMKELIERKLMR